MVVSEKKIKLTKFLFNLIYFWDPNWHKLFLIIKFEAWAQLDEIKYAQKDYTKIYENIWKMISNISLLF